MAQTTGGTSAVNAVVEFSVNGSSWTACSGHANKLSTSGGARATGEVLTFDGDTPILTAGKRGAIDVKLEAVYTETVGEIQKVARAAHQGGTPFYLRWTVKTATTGNLRYTTASGFVTDEVFPDVDASDAKPVMCSVTMKTTDIAEATIP